MLNILFYTQLAFVFTSSEIFILHFFFFALSFSTILTSFLGLFLPFIFTSSESFFSESFLCVFDNSYLSFLYMEKTFIKKYFINFLCFKNYVHYISILWITYNHIIHLNFLNKIYFIGIFLIRIFVIRIFSIGIRKNFYVISTILRQPKTIWFWQSQHI